MEGQFDKKYETLTVEVINETIAVVRLNNPKKLNSITQLCWREIAQVFTDINDYPFRVAILTGMGKHFTSGLDLKEASSLAPSDDGEQDFARQSLELRKGIQLAQDSSLAIVNCRVPVICAVNGYCYGAGIDLSSACDIRLCEEKATFCVAEVDIGMAADVGTVQRLPFLTGNESWAREICYTGRVFKGPEAQQFQYVSSIYKNQEELMENALKLAETIASKSPVAVWALKKSFVFNKEDIIRRGYEYILNLNMTLLRTNDMKIAILSKMQKKKPVFPKL